MEKDNTRTRGKRAWQIPIHEPKRKDSNKLFKRFFQKTPNQQKAENRLVWVLWKQWNHIIPWWIKRNIYWPTRAFIGPHSSLMKAPSFKKWASSLLLITNLHACTTNMTVKHMNIASSVHEKILITRHSQTAAQYLHCSFFKKCEWKFIHCICIPHLLL